MRFGKLKKNTINVYMYILTVFFCTREMTIWSVCWWFLFWCFLVPGQGLGCLSKTASGGSTYDQNFKWRCFIYESDLDLSRVILYYLFEASASFLNFLILLYTNTIELPSHLFWSNRQPQSHHFHVTQAVLDGSTRSLKKWTWWTWWRHVSAWPSYTMAASWRFEKLAPIGKGTSPCRN